MTDIRVSDFVEVNVDPRFNEWFKKYVPETGAAPTEGGEILRAAGRIGYAYLNAGDKLGCESGRDTCNPALFYLEKHCPKLGGLEDCWGTLDDDLYDKGLVEGLNDIVRYLDENPELFEKPCKATFNAFAERDDLYRRCVWDLPDDGCHVFGDWYAGDEDFDQYTEDDEEEEW